MTAYMLGTTVAHAMRFVGDGVWRSVCRSGPHLDNRAHFARYPHLPSPLLFYSVGEEPPTLPWCSRCTRAVIELARELGLTVDDPSDNAGRPAPE